MRMTARCRLRRALRPARRAGPDGEAQRPRTIEPTTSHTPTVPEFLSSTLLWRRSEQSRRAAPTRAGIGGWVRPTGPDSRGLRDLAAERRLTERSAPVEDLTAGAAAHDEPRRAKHREVIGDVAGRSTQAMASVVVVAGSSSNPRISARVGPIRRDRPARCRPALGRGAQPCRGRGRRGPVVHRRHAGGDEGRGLSSSPFSPSSIVAFVRCRTRNSCRAADDRREILEQSGKPSLGQAPRTGDIALEDLSHCRPGRLEQNRPDRGQRVGQPARRVGRAQHAQRVAVRLPRHRSLDLGPALPLRHLPDPRQLFVDVCRAVAGGGVRKSGM